MYHLPHSKNFGVKLTLFSYRYVATRIVMSRVIASPSCCDPSFYFDDIDLSIISKNATYNERFIFELHNSEKRYFIKKGSKFIKVLVVLDQCSGEYLV